MSNQENQGARRKSLSGGFIDNIQDFDAKRISSGCQLHLISQRIFFRMCWAFLDLSAVKDLHNNHMNVSSQTDVCNKGYFRGSKITE